jgi:protein gp37
MGDKTAIEWADASWNPVTGCTKISPGCDNCYAETFAERFRGVPGHPYEPGFDLTLRPERLVLPLNWKRPRKIFVNSMSDLFHKDVPEEYVDQVFEVMTQASQHRFQVLTKRSSRLRDYVNARYAAAPVPNHIWLGVSAENGGQKSRIEHLRQTNAGVRFLSVEPLLAPLGVVDFTGIHWVIVGGESGHKARPMDADWVRQIRDQCVASGVAFFFKQWGGYRPKANGRTLDGREWDEYPEAG